MKTHGMSMTRAYRIWRAILNRCLNKNQKAYPNYGGRGITVCDRWRNSFEAFVADMGEPPPGLTIDRVNNDRGYEPGNCRWVTPQANSRNRRSNRLLTRDGRTQTVAAWAEELGVRADLIHCRLGRGWSELDALNPPRGDRHVTA